MPLTARDLVAAGYSRTTAYRLLRAQRGTQAEATADAAAPRGPRRVLALVLPDAPAPMGCP